jgi:hypothetical protein
MHAHTLVNIHADTPTPPPSLPAGYTRILPSIGLSLRYCVNGALLSTKVFMQSSKAVQSLQLLSILHVMMTASLLTA